MSATLLIVEDEKHTREGLCAVLEEAYDVYEAENADEALRLMEEERFDVVLTDLRMAGKSGMSVIDKAIALPHKPVCIMMTAYGSVEAAVEAMRRGAFDFLTKPVNLEKLEMLIKRALHTRHLQEENTALHERLDKKLRFEGIVGQSPALRRVMEQVRQVAPARANVLLRGETGTGKELFAQMIHQNSPRAREPFIAVHCAAIAPNLLESELFGHEKGAFTGAAERRIGRFEAAEKGTLFLDEIGEIDHSTQVKLLRFLETRSLERLGSIKPIEVDVRLVCATNRNLEEMVKKGAFREDLYYRLNVVPIVLPPLRERAEDVEILFRHYMEQFSRENGVPVARLTPEAWAQLRTYHWPGNIRELRNVCENLVVMKRGAAVSAQDIAGRLLGVSRETAGAVAGGGVPAGPMLSREENEKQLLRQALCEAAGNRTRAAEMLGISRRTLHRKLAQWPELDVGSS